MKKLHKWLIGAGVAGALLLGANYYISKMKPKPQFLEKTESKEVLESKLIDSFDVNNLNIIRYNVKEPKFAVLTYSNVIGEGIFEDNNIKIDKDVGNEIILEALLSNMEHIRTHLFTIRDIKTDANSFGELLESGILEKIANKEENYLGEAKTITENQILSPITPINIIGLAYNYFEHAKEVGETEKFKGKNMVAFRKENSSLTGAFNEIVKPDEIRLLDYEVELGIVLKKKIDKDSVITENNLQEFIAGYVLVNDMSARDVQLNEGTLSDKTKGFRKGKSYDTFCPVGPIFLYSPKNPDFGFEQYLVREDKFYHLQKGKSSEIINSLYEIIKELQRRLNSDNEKEYRAFIDEKGNRNYSFEAGDLILTGTPAGVAFNFNVKYVIACGGKKGFINFEEKNNRKYLRKDDVLITQSKGLGYQKHDIE